VVVLVVDSWSKVCGVALPEVVRLSGVVVTMRRRDDLVSLNQHVSGVGFRFVRDIGVGERSSISTLSTSWRKK
jgi:hypothetical protein